ncbi:MAG TPA: roadblock/LC7 domain-containing protein [Streptosporangiaceae bacterium]|nr:roadblock/LC7 domain-containing protein [Streptosporangiaceae bacterium]
MRQAGQLDWLLDDLTARVPEVTRAVILSRDGLSIGASSSLTREESEFLSAAAAGLQSLARGTSGQFGGGDVRQTVVEMDHVILFVTAAGDGSCLAVLAVQGADLGEVAYEMTLLVRRVGDHMDVAHRPTAPA